MTKDRFVTFQAILDHPIHGGYLAPVSVNVADIGYLEALPVIKTMSFPENPETEKLRQGLSLVFPAVFQPPTPTPGKITRTRTRVHMKAGHSLHSSEPLCRLEKRFNLELRRG